MTRQLLWSNTRRGHRGHFGLTDLRAVRFADDDLCGWIIGREGVIFVIKDGGSTWYEQNSGLTVNLYGFAISAKGERAFATGQAGVVIATEWRKKDLFK